MLAQLKRLLAKISGLFSKEMTADTPQSVKPADHPSSLTSTQALELFLSDLKAQGSSESTIRNYSSDISQFIEFTKEANPERMLSEQNFKAFFSDQQSKGLKPSTIQRKIVSLKLFSDWLEKRNKKNIAIPVIPVFLGGSSQQVTHSTPAPSQKNSTTPWILMPYFQIATLIIFLILIALLTYRQFFVTTPQDLAFPSDVVVPSRILSFQGRMTDSAGTPITTATNTAFRLYTLSSGGTLLWNSGTCSIDPDQDGIFSTILGSTCGTELTSDIFSENDEVWLEIQIASETLTPRQRIATVAYALNSETLQGFPISATESATINTVVVMNEWGEILLGESNPVIRAVGGDFSISGETVTLTTNSGSNGNVVLDPDGTGITSVIGNLVQNGYLYTNGATISATYAGGTPLTVNGTGGTLMTITNAGAVDINGTVDISSSLTLSSMSNNGGVLYTNGSGLVAQTSVGDSGQCLQSIGGGTPSWGSCGSGSNWRITSGAISPINETLDFMLGATATSSAEFAVINVNSGTPTATLSAGATGGTYLTAAGVLQTTANQALTLGGSTTGDIHLLPKNSTGRVGINTTAPQGFLHIVGAGDVESFYVEAPGISTKPAFSLQNLPLSTTVSNGKAFEIKVTSEGFGRTMFYTDAAIGFGPGSSTRDVFIRRGGTNTMQIDSDKNGGVAHLTVTGDLAVNGDDITADGALTINSASYVRIGDTGTPGVASGDDDLYVEGDLEIDATATFASTVTMSSFTANGGVLYTNGSGVVAQTTVGSSGECLKSIGGGAPEWGSCGGAGSNWRIATGAISPANDTLDFLIGSNATSSAKFAVINVNSGTPIASLSAGAAGGTYLTAAGTLQTTANQSLTLGGDTTGDIFFRPLNSTGAITADLGATALFNILDGNLKIGNGTPGLTQDGEDGYVEGTFEVDGQAQFDGNVDATNGLDVTTANLTVGGANFTVAPGTGNITSAGDLAVNGDDITADGALTINSASYVRIGDTGTPGTASGDDDLYVEGDLEVDGGALFDGSLTISGFSNNGGVLYTNGSGVVAQTAVGSAGQCLKSIAGGTPVFADCAGGTAGFNITNGAYTPINETLDFMLGGTATSSAEFAVININSGTPTATLSAGVNGGTYLTATGILQTTANQTLTLGGDTTGNISLLPLNGTGSITADLGATALFNILDGNLKIGNGTPGLTQDGEDGYVEGTFEVDGQAQFDGNVDATNGLDVTTANLTVGGANFTVAPGTGNITTAGDLAVNGDDITADGFLTINSASYVRIGDTGTPGTASGDDDLYVEGDLEIDGGALFDAGVTISSFSANGGILYTNGSGVVAQTAVGDSGQCLQSIGGGTPAWGSCGGAGSNWRIASGAISPVNDTLDLLVGNTATSSAKFAVINVNSGTPTATLSAGAAGGAYLTATGTLQTTAKQRLNIGGSTTGDVSIQAFTDGTNQSGSILVSGPHSGPGNVTIRGGQAAAEQAGHVYIAGGGGSPQGNVYLGYTGSSAVGNVTVGSSTATSLFNVGSSAQLQIDTSGNLTTSGDLAVNGDDITADGALTINSASYVRIGDTGTPGTASGDDDLYVEGDLEIDGGALFDAGVTISTFTANGGLLYTNGSGVLAQTAVGSSGECLKSIGGGTPAWGVCATDNFWRINSGAISPVNDTLDFLVGNTATSSAKFAVINVNSGTPIASLSAGVNGGAYLTAAGTLQTTANQHLTIGGNTTGDISLVPRNGVGQVSITSDLSQGARTSSLVNISQPNDAGNNSSAALLEMSNADTGSNTPLISLDQQATAAEAISLQVNTDYTGTLVNFSEAYYTTSGTLLSVGTTNSTLSTSTARDFSGNLIRAGLSKSYTGASTQTDSGNYLNLQRNALVNNASGTYNITGDIAALSSTLTETSGTMTDSSNILSLAQNCGTNASCTGAVLDITNAGTGQGILLTSSSTGVLAQLDASGTGTTADGLLIRQTSSGAITDAIDATDAEIVNALNFGTNTLLGSTGNIDMTHFDVVGSSGNISTNGTLRFDQGVTSVLVDTTNVALTSGTGLGVTGSSLTTGYGINIDGSTSGSGLTAFSGDAINVAMTRTQTGAGTLTDTGSYLNLVRTGVQSTSTGTYNITGDLAVLSSTCSQSGGTCADTSNILSLAQNYAAASGAVIELSNAGTGADIDFNSTTPTISMDDTGTFSLTDGTNTLFAIKDQGVYSFLNIGGKTDAGDPATCAEGDTYYNASDNTFNVCTATDTWTNALAVTASLFTDGGTVTYLTDTAEDFAVGASNTLVAPFSVDVDTQTTRLGTGSGANAILNMYASGGQTGSITYNTSDEWNFTGGNINLDGALDLDTDSATALTVGDGTNNYLTVDTTTDAADTLLTLTGTSGTITSGSIFSLIGDTITTGTGFSQSYDGLTTGTGVSVQSTSTAFTTGKLANFEWAPTGSTEIFATGNLFNINLGQYGNLDHIFNVQDNGSDIFSVDQAIITSANPHEFTAPGDVSIAYDIEFTNQTSSFIKTSAPFTIEVGETFENNDLTLRTYGTGALVVDAVGGSEFTRSGNQVAFFDRTTSDGTIISLRQANTEEGTISVSGTTVSYNAFTGSHYAWTQDTIEKGKLVTLTGDNYRLGNRIESEILYGIAETTTENDPRVMGSYLSLQEQNKIASALNPHLVMAVGNGEVWVVDNGSDLQAGDYLISSGTKGHAMKDTGTFEKSYIVGRVAEDVEWDTVTAEVNGKKHKRISVFFESFVKDNQIELNLTADGSLTSNYTIQATPIGPTSRFEVISATTSQVVTRAATFAQLIVGQIKAGLIETAELVADRITVREKLVSPVVETDQLTTSKIVSKKDENLNVDLTGNSKLQVNDASGEAVFSVDQSGDATISGTLTTTSSRTQQLEAQKAQLAELNVTDATISGTLFLPDGRSINGILAENEQYLASISGQTSAIQDQLSQAPDAVSADSFDQFLTQLTGSDDASISATLATLQAEQNITLSEEDVILAPDAVFVKEYLSVSGFAQFTNANVSNNLSVGNSLLLTGDTLATSEETLFIQPVNTGRVNILAGLLVLNSEGNVEINGDLIVSGDITSKGKLSTNTLQPDNFSSDFSLKLATQSADLGETTQSAFNITNASDEAVASIDASGSARFKSLAAQGLTIKQPTATATDSASLADAKKLSTVGSLTLPAGETELVVENVNVDEASLIYLTPTSDTANQVLYLKDRETCSGAFVLQSCQKSFTVGIKQAVTKDITFNYWIVKTE